jgi:hypothetical protein
MSNLGLIAPKLGKLLRMLASDHDGEVVAATRAIRRTLEAEKLDIHALAETVEASNGIRKFSEADALEIYQRGVREGRSAAEAERGFTDIDDEPDWDEIARTCQAYPSKLFGDHEREFVDDMVHRTRVSLGLSEKQQAWLRKIYMRVRK